MWQLFETGAFLERENETKIKQIMRLFQLNSG